MEVVSSPSEAFRAKLGYLEGQFSYVEAPYKAKTISARVFRAKKFNGGGLQPLGGLQGHVGVPGGPVLLRRGPLQSND